MFFSMACTHSKHPVPAGNRTRLTRWPLPVAGAILAAGLISGCSRSDPAYFPLDDSRWWYYAVSETILDEHRNARYIAANATAAFDGHPVTLQASQTMSLDYLRSVGEGAERVANRRPGTPGVTREEAARVVLPDTLEPGHSWNVPSTLGLIESRTFARVDRVIMRRYPVDIEKSIVADDVSVRVPAGRFDDCIEVEGEGRRIIRTDRGNSKAAVVVRVTEWYAQGVGLVRLEREERSDSPFLKTGKQTWELVEYGD